jgi:hypothetical protein
MNREDIIRMAREAGFNVEQGYLLRITGIDEDLERFASLVASAEREACADIAENWNSNGFPRVGVAAQIRAREQV